MARCYGKPRSFHSSRQGLPPSGQPRFSLCLECNSIKAEFRILKEFGILVILLLHRFCHFLFHRVIQIFCLQLAERITRRFQMIRQLLSETLVEGMIAEQVPESLSEELVKG